MLHKLPKNTQPLISFAIGLIVGGASTYMVFSTLHTGHIHGDSHPIADPFDSEYHVHADFHIVVNDTLVDLSGDNFQTTSQQTLHPDAHLHDNNGDVKHIHAEGITFVEFLESLSISLTDTCITLDNQYCDGTEGSLQMYVNDELYTEAITEYIPVDNDRILVYFGDPNNPELTTYINNVPDDACYYSGTCPERGIAPPESCGETCEL